MFGELEAQTRTLVADLEAGVGTLLRVQEGQADLAFIVAQPHAKAIEVARRGLAITAARAIPAVLVANRVSSAADAELIRDALRPDVPVAVVPDDPAVARADEEGLAPLDAAPDSDGVRAIAALLGFLRR